jgi:hypothetical protein
MKLTISVKFLNSLDGQIKIDVNQIIYRIWVKIYLAVQFRVISNIFLFIYWWGTISMWQIKSGIKDHIILLLNMLMIKGNCIQEEFPEICLMLFMNMSTKAVVQVCCCHITYIDTLSCHLHYSVGFRLVSTWVIPLVLDFTGLVYTNIF